MGTLTEKIKSELKEGYKLVDIQSHKSSTYYYITNPDDITLTVRISDHDAIAAASIANLQILYSSVISLDFGFDPVYDDEDYEIEITKEIAVKQLNERFGVEITENMIADVDAYNFNLDWKEMPADLINTILAIYISNKITEVEPTILY